MTPSNRELLEHVLTKLFPHRDYASALKIADNLDNEGLIDRRALERLFARFETERLARCGMGRCRAMEEVAEQLCCSYEKVRNMVYATDRPARAAQTEILKKTEK